MQTLGTFKCIHVMVLLIFLQYSSYNIQSKCNLQEVKGVVVELQLDGCQVKDCLDIVTF